MYRRLFNFLVELPTTVWPVWQRLMGWDCIVFITTLSLSATICRGVIRKRQMMQKDARGGDVCKGTNACPTIIILGSGGHTAEMLAIMRGLNHPTIKYTPRTYVIQKTDKLSLFKVEEEERGQDDEYEVEFVTRLREVGESWIKVVFYKLPIVMFESFCILRRVKPKLVLCNGPGVCVPFGLWTVFQQVMFLAPMNIFYVESYCRVKTLSMTGKIMTKIADVIFVQWPELQELVPRSHCRGRLS